MASTKGFDLKNRNFWGFFPGQEVPKTIFACGGQGCRIISDKYVANRFLTFFQNLLLGAKLSEYHTGFRTFSRKVLESLPLLENSDDFVFDNEMLAQVIYFNFPIGEVSCPTRYFEEASSINFPRSVKYGLGVVLTSVKFALQKLGWVNFRIFAPYGRGLKADPYYSDQSRDVCNSGEPR